MQVPFFFPTTVVVIDDDPKIIEILSSLFSNMHFRFKYFQDPLKAIEFIKFSPTFNVEKYFSCLQESKIDFLAMQQKIGFDIKNLHEEAFNFDRFNIISTIIVDYNMPGMNGLELLENIYEFTDARKILLTGYMKPNNAVKIKGEIIDDYLQKKFSGNIGKELITALNKSVRNFFLKISSPITVALKLNNSFSVLYDKAFIEFFQDFCYKNSILEYYLIEEMGCFFMINSNNNFLIFHTDTKGRLNAVIDEYKEEIPKEKLKMLEQYKMTIYAYKDNNFFFPDLKNYEQFLTKTYLVKGYEDLYVSIYKKDFLTANSKRKIKFFYNEAFAG